MNNNYESSCECVVSTRQNKTNKYWAARVKPPFFSLNLLYIPSNFKCPEAPSTWNEGGRQSRTHVTRNWLRGFSAWPSHRWQTASEQSWNYTRECLSVCACVMSGIRASYVLMHLANITNIKRTNCYLYTLAHISFEGRVPLAAFKLWKWHWSFHFTPNSYSQGGQNSRCP